MLFAGFTASNVVLFYLLTYFPPRLIRLRAARKSRAELAAENEGEEEEERLIEEGMVTGIRGGL